MQVINDTAAHLGAGHVKDVTEHCRVLSACCTVLPLSKALYACSSANLVLSWHTMCLMLQVWASLGSCQMMVLMPLPALMAPAATSRSAAGRTPQSALPWPWACRCHSWHT